MEERSQSCGIWCGERSGEISTNIFDMSVSQRFNTNTVTFRVLDVVFETQNSFRLIIYRVTDLSLGARCVYIGMAVK